MDPACLDQQRAEETTVTGDRGFEVSLSNIIALATILVALAVGWQTLASDVAASNRRIDKNDKQLEVIATERIRQTEILTELRADVRYLRERIGQLRPEDKSR